MSDVSSIELVEQKAELQLPAPLNEPIAARHPPPSVAEEQVSAVLPSGAQQTPPTTLHSVHSPLPQSALSLKQASAQRLHVEIADDHVRAYLDSSDSSIRYEDLAAWPPEQIDRLLNAVQPHHLRTLIEKAQASGVQNKAKTLSWSHVHLTDANSIPRLTDVSGYLCAGELVGLIGAPDAGATSLLRLLAGQRMEGAVTGELLYDQLAISADHHKSVGFVPQKRHAPSSAHRRGDAVLLRSPPPAARPARPTDSHSSAAGSASVGPVGGSRQSHRRQHCERHQRGPEATSVHRSGTRRWPLGFVGRPTYQRPRLSNSSQPHPLLSPHGACRSIHARVGRAAGTRAVSSLPQSHRVEQRGGHLLGPPSLAEPYFYSVGLTRPSIKSIPQYLEEVSAEPEAFRASSPDPIEHERAARAIHDRIIEQGYDVDVVKRMMDNQFLSLPSAGSTERVVDDRAVQLGHAKPGQFSVGVDGKNTARVEEWSTLVVHYRSTVFSQDVDQHLGSSSTVPSAKVSPAGRRAERDWLWRWRWSTRFNSSPWLQLRETFLRQARLVYRTPSLWLHIWISFTILGLLLGSLFYRLNSEEEQIRTRIGLYFYVTAVVCFNSFGLLPVILAQRSIVYTQTRGNYYSAMSYYFSFIAVQFLTACVELMLMLLPIWGLSNLAGHPMTGSFWYGFLVILTAGQVARNWIVFLLYLSPSAIVATTVLTVTFYLFALVSGEFVPKPLVPSAWRWSFSISFFSYALNGLVLNDPVNPTVVQQLLGYDVTESKWVPYEKLIYFLLSFSAAALTSMTFLRWHRDESPVAADFSSPTSVSLTQQRAAHQSQPSTMSESETADRSCVLTRRRVLPAVQWVELQCGAEGWSTEEAAGQRLRICETGSFGGSDRQVRCRQVHVAGRAEWTEDNRRRDWRDSGQWEASRSRGLLEDGWIRGAGGQPRCEEYCGGSAFLLRPLAAVCSSDGRAGVAQGR